LTLSEFGDPADITFRVKVVDISKKLLGECDNVKAGEHKDLEREPLITLFAVDLGEEI
jgi:hypothetical protein